jgi:hypothetical protein
MTVHRYNSSQAHLLPIFTHVEIQPCSSSAHEVFCTSRASMYIAQVHHITLRCQSEKADSACRMVSTWSSWNCWVLGDTCQLLKSIATYLHRQKALM